MNSESKLTISDVLLLTSNESLSNLVQDSRSLISSLIGVENVDISLSATANPDDGDNKTLFNIAKDGRFLGQLRIDAPQDIEVEYSHIYPVLALIANQISLLIRCSSDLLTGLYNRQALDERMREVFAGAHHSEKRKYKHNRVIAVIDIDFFKQINDTYGHLYGDEILVLFSGILRQSFRAEDWLFRYGGDEFVVVMNDATLDDARMVLERLGRNVSKHSFPKVDSVTMSIGYTTIDSGVGVGEIFDRADHALYYVKQQGRDGFCSYEELENKGLGKGEAYDSGDVELF